LVNQVKQYKKLLKFAAKAQVCSSREEAQKLIIKADKAQAKLSTLPLLKRFEELS
jgi:ribosome-associated toxin RatA of RatAB toxin-antitoxin module